MYNIQDYRVRYNSEGIRKDSPGWTTNPGPVQAQTRVQTQDKTRIQRYRGEEIRGRNLQTHYRAQAQPRSDLGPVQAQARVQAQYRTWTQIRTQRIHTRGGGSNQRRFMIK